MDIRAALQSIAAAVADGRMVKFGDHAIDESMPDDHVAEADVLNVLAHPTGILPANDDGTKWKVYGRIVSGADYAVVVRIRSNGEIVVVTTHNPP